MVEGEKLQKGVTSVARELISIAFIPIELGKDIINKATDLFAGVGAGSTERRKKLEITAMLVKDEKKHTVRSDGTIGVGKPFTVDAIVANRYNEDVDADVLLTIDGKQIPGTERKVHIYARRQVTTAGTKDFDTWSVVITEPKLAGYNLCVVARPLTPEVVVGVGCKKIHVE